MLRKRKINSVDEDNEFKENNRIKPKISSNKILLFYVGILLISYVVIFKISKILPTKLSHSEDHSAFVGEYALSNLTKFIDKTGERLTGSHNLKTATLLIYDELLRLKSINNYHEVSIETQKAAGTFTINFLESFINTYSNVTNVVLKIGPSNRPALLVNCHYDSVLGAAGASDDAVNCFTLIEIIRILIVSKQHLKNSIIFLFNGAEEMILQGSHGFIQNHRWAPSVRAVINLDACGTPGRLLLFQSGAQGWMLKAYAKVVKYPYGGGALLTFYRTGLIPMQTDYYIFHKVAHLEASLDFAFIQNNYIYHTKNDVVDFIDPGGVQSAGEDLLSLIKEVVNGDDLGSGPRDAGSDRYGYTYTLDVLGLTFVAYPLWFDRLATWTVCLLAWLYVYANGRARLVKVNNHNTHALRRQANIIHFKELALACGSLLMGWASCFGSAMAVAWFLSLTGCLMSWFNHSILIVGLFHVPALLGLLAFHTSKLNPLNKARFPQADQMIFEASVLVGSLFCALLSCYRLEFGNLFWLWLLCALVGPLLLTLRSKFTTPSNQNSIATALALVPTLAPAWIFIYVYFVMGANTIPIMGLMGHTLKPDYLLAALCSIQVVALFHYVVTFAYKEKHDTNRLVGLLFVVGLVSLALATMTPLGFPFSSNPKSPALSRQYVVHVNREFHRILPNGADKTYANDSGLWVMPLDTYGFYYLAKRHAETPTSAQQQPDQGVVVDCERWVYCGMPYRLPVRTNIKKTLYIPAPPVTLPAETIDILTTDLNPTTKRITFNISDVRQLSVVICPQGGWNLTSFSMAPAGVPFPLKFRYQGRKTHFAIYVNGEEEVQTGSPYIFSLTLAKLHEGDVEDRFGIADITLTLHYMTSPFSGSNELGKFVDDLPQWIHAVPYTARYLHYAL